jgi:hypothetical protein
VTDAPPGRRDHEMREIGSFDSPRRFAIAVAGPAALLVSKLHKLAERADEPGRTKDEDPDPLDPKLKPIQAPAVSHHLVPIRTEKRDS